MMGRLKWQAVVVVLVLGLSSCATVINSGSPQTVEPSPSASPSPSPSPVTVLPAEAHLPAWWQGEVPAEGAYWVDYEYSDTPQTEDEQWILDNYPRYWEWGVRVVTPQVWDGPAGPPQFRVDDKKAAPVAYPDSYGIAGPWEPTPAPLVQYVDGVRYDGTPALPLGFFGYDPTKPPAAVAEAYQAWFERKAVLDHKAVYSVSYSVSIIPDTEAGGFVLAFLHNGEGVGRDSRSLTVESIEEGLEIVRTSAVRPDEHVFGGESQNRAFYPGEYVVLGRATDDDPLRVLLD